MLILCSKVGEGINSGDEYPPPPPPPPPPSLFSAALAYILLDFYLMMRFVLSFCLLVVSW